MSGLELVKNLRPNPAAQKLFVTHPAIIRCGVQRGTIEVVMAKSYTTPRHQTEYEEVCTLLWPTPALLPARVDLDVAFEALLRRELLR
jgi:hypothetical protein